MADRFRNSRDNDPSDENDLSFSFESYSKSLDKNSSSLSDNSKEIKSIGITLTKLDKTLAGFSKKFDSLDSSIRTVGTKIGSDKGSGDRDKAQTDGADLRDTSRAFERNIQATDKALTKGQKLGNTLITSFKAAGQFLIKEFVNSVGRVSDSYVKHLSTTTVKMEWSNKDYGDMYNAVADAIIKEGLNKQFSPTDYADALETVLDTGLRGDQAQEVAFRNLITNKLMPSISTNTRAYTRLSQLMGGTFQEGITSIAKYAEQNIGAVGIEEGQLNNVIETLKSDILYQSNGDADKAQRMMDEVVATYSSIAQQYGQNVAEEFLNVTKDQLTAAPGEGSLAMTAGTNAVGQEFFDLWDKRGLSEIFDRWSDAVVNWTGDLESAQAISGDMGFTVDTYKDLVSGTKYNGTEIGQMSDTVNEFLKEYATSDTYQKEMGNLQKGYYQSADDQLSKIEENLTTGVSVWKSGIARFDSLLTIASAILTAVTTNYLFTKTKGSMSGEGAGGSLLKNLFSSSKSSASMSAAKGVLESGTGTVAKTAGTAGASTTALVGTTVVGGLLTIAGLAHGGMNAADAVKNTNGDTGDKVKSGFEGFFAGDTSGARTNNEKLAEVRKNSGAFGIDWKKVGNASKTGALTGAGVGAIAGGVVGTSAFGIGAVPGAAIGAGIGGVFGAAAGAVTSVTTQMIKYGDQIAYTKSELGKLAETVEENNNAIVEMNSQVGDYASLMKQYESLQDRVNDSTGVEKTLLETKLKLMETEVNLKIREMGTADQVKSQVDELGKNFETGYNMSEFANKLMTEMTQKELEGLNLDKESITKMDYDEILKKLGMDKESAEDLVSSAKKANYITSDASTEDAIRKLAIDYASGLGVVEDANVKGSDLDKIAVNGKSAYQGLTSTALQETMSALSQSMSDISQNIATGTSNLKTLSGLKSPEISALHAAMTSTLQSYLSQDVEGKTISELTGFDNVEGFMQNLGFSDEVISQYKDFIKSNSVGDGRAEGWFKVGINSVPHDNFKAVLHKGEMVLTSDNADSLRDIMSGGGLSGLLNGVKNLMGVQASATAQNAGSELSSVNLIDAINSQTQSLMGVLSSILEAVLQIKPNSSNTTPAQLSQSYVSFGTEV